jgi:hypothetical protein
MIRRSISESWSSSPLRASAASVMRCSASSRAGRDLRFRSRDALAIEQLAAFAIRASQLQGIVRVAHQSRALAPHHANFAQHRRHDERGQPVQHDDEREVGNSDREAERALAPDRKSEELERHDERRGARPDFAEPEGGR